MTKKKTTINGDEKLPDFRQKVVAIALEAADEHGWCAEVKNVLHKKMGLGEFLPDVFYVQQKYSARSKWKDYLEGDDKDDAIESAERYSKPRNEYPYYNDYFSATVSPSMDIEAEVLRLRSIYERAVEATTKVVPVPEYPKWRVVSRPYVGKANTVGEVVWEPETKA